MAKPDLSSRTFWVAALSTVAVTALCLIQKRPPTELEIGGLAGLWSASFHRDAVVRSSAAAVEQGKAAEVKA